MKKFLAMFMVFAMAASALSFTVGCGDAKKDAPKKDTPAETKKDDVKK